VIDFAAIESMDLSTAWTTLGYGGAAGWLLRHVVDFWKLPQVQAVAGKFLPYGALWDNMSELEKRFLVFVFSCIAGVVTAVAGQMSWAQALLTIPIAAFSAHVLNGSGEWSAQKKSSITTP